MNERAELIEALAGWWAVHDGDTNLKGRYVALFAELTDVQIGDVLKHMEYQMLQSPMRSMTQRAGGRHA